jgi:hypothetical protein
MGLNQYPPNRHHSDDFLKKMLAKHGKNNAVLSQGKYYFAIYSANSTQPAIYGYLRTIYGIEYWTFVCCDKKTGEWNFDPIKPGRFPSLSNAANYTVNGESGPTKWDRMPGCVYVHSHNLVIVEKRWGQKMKKSAGSSKLSPSDMKIAINYLDVIAVSDDNFDDFVPIAKPIKGER